MNPEHSLTSVMLSKSYGFCLNGCLRFGVYRKRFQGLKKNLSFVLRGKLLNVYRSTVTLLQETLAVFASSQV